MFRRCAPTWLLLVGHVLVCWLAGYMHPVAILHLAIVAVWTTTFLTGTGLYFIALCRRTTRRFRRRVF